MVTTNHKSILDTHTHTHTHTKPKIERKELEHNTKASHQITREDRKRKRNEYKKSYKNKAKANKKIAKVCTFQ